MTVRQLLASIDSRELTEWRAYERETGPLGAERLDHLVARVCATLLRVNTARAEDQRRIKDDDFLIKWNGGGQHPDGDDS